MVHPQMEIRGSENEPQAQIRFHKSALTDIALRPIVLSVKRGLPLQRIDHLAVTSDGAGSNCIEHRAQKSYEEDQCVMPNLIEGIADITEHRNRR